MKLGRLYTHKELGHFSLPFAFINFFQFMTYVCFTLCNLQKAVQASPKNRYAWHVWGVFEANMGNIDMGRKLLKIGHNLNPRDAVLLQSLALLEYQYSTANVARVLFRRASELNPRHQPVWFVRNFFSWILSVLNIIIQIFIPFCMICCEVSLT